MNWEPRIENFTERHGIPPVDPNKPWFVSKQVGWYKIGRFQFPNYVYLHSDGVWRKSSWCPELGYPGAYYATKEEAQQMIDLVESKENHNEL